MVAPIRCYRVIPLHQRAGVLEWVADAVPIGDYLHGAHSRYHPDDWSLSYCRQVARQEAERAGSTFATKKQVFLDIQAHLRPVFHRFFLERFLALEGWLMARRLFSASCASTSMMGHVMGLGDRHCQNILIDCRTGQLVHIDLNMIFEQGRTLRVPERVPFRLTRDMLDGMGPWGVEHGFRTCSAHFLTQLRLHADYLLMILEVFKHDPLHHWPTPAGAEQRERGRQNTKAGAFDKLSDLQSPHFDTPPNHRNHHNRPAPSTVNQSTSGFDMADRALLRVREKVSGREEGAEVSVAAQVEFLIQQATSADSLSQMYCGWQPWL
jgi:ataxia telangiectasia mutated family protein